MIACIHFVQDCHPLNYVFVVYEWSLSDWNFSVGVWCPPNNLQRQTIFLVLKPSSPMENNPFQMWRDIDVDSSCIPWSKWALLFPNVTVIDFLSYSLTTSDHQSLLKYYTSLVQKKTFMRFPWINLWNPISPGWKLNLTTTFLLIVEHYEKKMP